MSSTHIANRFNSAVGSLVAVLILISGIFAGCSKSVPTDPDLKSGLPSGDTDLKSVLQHYPWGLWNVLVDPESGTAEIEPLRNVDAHWNVTSLINPDKCAGCIEFSDLQFIDSDSIKVTVAITHPFSDNPALDAFDVNGVVLGSPVMEFPSGTISALVENPDGYTARWSTEPWADINPFIDFAVENPERKFASGETHSRDYIIHILKPGPIQFMYVIDACWLPQDQIEPGNPHKSPHANEGYDVNVTVDGVINAIPGSLAEVTVKFSDWQNDGDMSDVSIEIPGLLAKTFKLDFTGKKNPYEFAGFVSNELFAAPGIYDALVCIRDTINNPETDNLATFSRTEIMVTSETPMVKGVTVYPEIISVREQYVSANFTAYKILSDGSKTLCADDVDWTIDGTDLNGNLLAEIDGSGKATRLTSRWWGGAVTVEAKYLSYEAHATLFCEDPFADSCSVDFGELNEPGTEYTDPASFAGPPNGAGSGAGGLNVCSIGYGGIATLEFTNNVAMNGDGPDLIIFENPMITGAPCDWEGKTQLTVWNETAAVEVSMDGINWFRFPCDYNPDNFTCVANPWMNPSSYIGLAGNYPVYAGVDEIGTLKNGIDPTDPGNSGGDLFELDDVGLPWCRFVRLIDTGDPDWPSTQMHDDDGDLIFNYGNMSPLGSVPNVAGFDGDSVAACYSEPITSIQ